MQLLISKTDTLDNKSDFIYSYLVDEIWSFFLATYDDKRADQLEHDFNINVFEILEDALNNLFITETPTQFIIKIDKRRRIDNVSIEKLVKLITYGTRNTKGYPIIIDVFNYISKNINLLYERWLHGY